AFHDRLRGERSDVAQTQHRGAVGDHADEVALGGVVVDALPGFLDLETGLGNSRAVSEAEILGGSGRLCRKDLDLSLAAARVVVESLFAGDLAQSISLLPGGRCSRASKLLTKLLHRSDNVLFGNSPDGLVPPAHDLDLPLFPGASADVDANWNPQEISVFELDSGTLVPIVIENLEAGLDNRLVGG